MANPCSVPTTTLLWSARACQEWSLSIGPGQNPAHSWMWPKTNKQNKNSTKQTENQNTLALLEKGLITFSIHSNNPDKANKVLTRRGSNETFLNTQARNIHSHHIDDLFKSEETPRVLKGSMSFVLEWYGGRKWELGIQAHETLDPDHIVSLSYLAASYSLFSVTSFPYRK